MHRRSLFLAVSINLMPKIYWIQFEKMTVETLKPFDEFTPTSLYQMLSLKIESFSILILGSKNSFKNIERHRFFMT